MIADPSRVRQPRACRRVQRTAGIVHECAGVTGILLQITSSL
jgi:hypothetical protein